MGWHTTITARESDARAALERFIREAPIGKIESMLSEMLYERGYNASIVSDDHGKDGELAIEAERGDDSCNPPKCMETVSEAWLQSMVDRALDLE